PVLPVVGVPVPPPVVGVAPPVPPVPVDPVTEAPGEAEPSVPVPEDELAQPDTAATTARARTDDLIRAFRTTDLPRGTG
ncbi:MAG TPA: hypothetical protein VKB59_11450, partial [Micromonosporaceae bacterium]|nr:hypothetical protein [Micromonosporaceae bacterium]